MATFLQLTNRVLVRLNETELTSSNFAGATGFHSQAKEAVNSAIKDVHRAEEEWPFNKASGSQELTPGIQLYSLPSGYTNIDLDTFFVRPRDELTNGAFTSDITSWTDLSTGTGSIAHTTDGNGRARLAAGSSGVAALEQQMALIKNSDYAVIIRTFTGDIIMRIGTTSAGQEILADTDVLIDNNVQDEGQGTFNTHTFIASDDVVYIGFRHTTNANHDIDLVTVRRDIRPKPLYPITYDVWHRSLRGTDFDMLPAAYRIPQYVFRNNQEQFGVTPIPDEPFLVEFDYWSQHSELSAHGDSTTIPTRYDNIILDGAMYYAYMFRDNFESADRIRSKFENGITDMRTRLIERPKRMGIR